MNTTQIASDYRRMARILADEATKWSGSKRVELGGMARDLVLSASDPMTIDPIVAKATLDTAYQVWMRASAMRGIELLGRMLDARRR